MVCLEIKKEDAEECRAENIGVVFDICKTCSRKRRRQDSSSLVANMSLWLRSKECEAFEFEAHNVRLESPSADGMFRSDNASPDKALSGSTAPKSVTPNTTHFLILLALLRLLALLSPTTQNGRLREFSTTLVTPCTAEARIWGLTIRRCPCLEILGQR